MDPDIPVPSIESGGQAVPSLTIRTQSKASPTRTPSSDRSPSKTPFKTPRSRPASPTRRSTSRSPSVASLRNDRNPPTLQRKTSTPNFSASRGLNSASAQQVQYRRTSSILNPATPTKMKSMNENFPQRPQWTPSMVAQDYFRKELDKHQDKASKVVVIVHDSCYGHRYSRPRTTKATLASIVERPERIHATLLGVSTAYVRLGDRHKDGQHHPHPDRNISTISDLPFVVRKITRSVQLNHPAVIQVHGSKWMEELQLMCDSAESNLSLGRNELSRPVGYGRDDKGKVLPALHQGDLYLSSESLNAMQGCLGGVCEAIDLVYQSELTRRAFVCIRPPGHHCSSNFPSGFCWLNNVHVGIAYAAMNHGLTHAAIIDFDLHHGDGSQTITWDHNRNAQTLPKNAAAHRKTPIGYYSLHDINSYPCEMGDEEKVRNASTCLQNAHGQSIWNVHLESWKSHQDFWTLYETKYKVLLEKTRAFLKHHSDQLRMAGIQPKPAIFLSSGFDASEWESEGMQRHKVNVPTDFYARFTSDVVDLAAEADLAVDGRIISVLEGGYSDRALTSGVLSHICGLTKDVPVDELSPPLGAGLSVPLRSTQEEKTLAYTPDWWALDELEGLEAIAAGRLPPPKKMKDKPPGSYSSPTQASTAKMTETARERRSLSAQLETKLFLESAPLEPPPEVDWMVAAYELSRLIIPKDRQTESCTHEELNAEATKARKERQSAIGVVAPVLEEKRQLRDRKPKPIHEISVRSTSRNGNRRTTIASVSDLPDPSMREPSERPRRRSSAASSVLSSFQDLKLEEKDEDEGLQNPPVQGSGNTANTAARKTKAPVRKPTGSRTNSPRKPKSQVAVQPSASTAQSNLPVTASDKVGKSFSASRQSGTTSSSGNDGMNELTNGMKKVSIKLKMPTEEQHAENQRKAEIASAETMKPPKPKLTRKTTAPKAPRTSQVPSKPVKSGKDKEGSSLPPSNVVDNTPVQIGTTKSSQPPSSSGETVDGILATNVVSSIPITSVENPASLETTRSGGVEPHPAKPIVSDVSGVAQTDQTASGVASHQSVTISNTQQNLAQRSAGGTVPAQPHPLFGAGNSGMMSPRPKPDLPVFTSSSPIPFAKPNIENQGTDNKENTNKPEPLKQSIWDIPETPQKPGTS